MDALIYEAFEYLSSLHSDFDWDGGATLSFEAGICFRFKWHAYKTACPRQLESLILAQNERWRQA